MASYGGGAGVSDLISRQALMKEFSDFVRESNNSDFAQTPTWNDAVSLVGSMPSAQQEIIRCKDCKHRIVNEHYGQKGYIKLKAMCELDTGDYFELGRNAEDDDWFCADAERRTDG